MKTQTDKTQEQQNSITPRVANQSSNGGTAQLKDNRTSSISQRKLRSGMDSMDNSNNPIQRKNKTGLPDNLKSGIENLSGYSMDDVKVHYNSSKPAQLQAHAYAQGTDIHLAPGQEKHLPHEAWHVVQQKQGRVKPTRQLKSKVNINDDAGLEKEADVMGKKANFLLAKPVTYNSRNLNMEGMSNHIPNIRSLSQDIQPIQRVPIPVNHGEFEQIYFDSDNYKSSTYDIRKASITIKFTPENDFGADGDRISLVQTVNDTMTYARKNKEPEENWRKNKRAEFEGRRTDDGWAIDQQIIDEKSRTKDNIFIPKNERPIINLDPRYAEQRKTIEATNWKEPLSEELRSDKLKQRGVKHSGQILQGEVQSALKSNGAWRHALLSDAPSTSSIKEKQVSGRMLFEVAALYEPQDGAAQWLGTVSWGWEISEEGDISLIHLELKSDDGLTAEFTDAKNEWNEQTILGESTLPLP
ncbi:DUF4157 domain-containing protein [Aquimarina sp. SS2-1]|uniref:eCIS core domain-containing protein n=1 Tax=Aquimarina besae TaxID=3342247 RepID=UPI00366B9166